MQILAHASWFVTTKDDLPRQYLDSQTISAHRPTNMPPVHNILPCDLHCQRFDAGRCPQWRPEPLKNNQGTARAPVALIGQNLSHWQQQQQQQLLCILRSRKACKGHVLATWSCLSLGIITFMAWQSLLRLLANELG